MLSTCLLCSLNFIFWFERREKERFFSLSVLRSSHKVPGPKKSYSRVCFYRDELELMYIDRINLMIFLLARLVSKLEFC